MEKQEIYIVFGHALSIEYTLMGLQQPSLARLNPLVPSPYNSSQDYSCVTGIYPWAIHRATGDFCKDAVRVFFI